jgi:peptidoglycan/LPS O-acetylase OafA/YrhL
LDHQRPRVPLLHSLEGLRLVSSLGIVAIHMLPHVGLRPSGEFSLFVDLFFVISGIVIGNLYSGAIGSAGDYRLFLRRRLARIYPLHVATLLFYVLIGIGVTRYHLRVDDPSRFDTAQILPNLLLVQAWFPDGRLSFNFVSWSISAEFFVYLLFPLIDWLVARRVAVGLAMVVLLLVLGIFVAEWGFGTRLYDLRWNCAPPRALPSFAFGVWLSRVAPRIAPAIRPALLQTVFVASALAMAAGMLLDLSGYAVLAAVYVLVTTAYLCDLRGIATVAAWKPLSDRGYLTYSLYMLHVPVTTVFISFVFPRLIGTTPAAQFVSVLLALAILFGASWASFRWFENPLRKLLR